MILGLGFQHSSLIHRLVCQLDGKLSVSSSDIMLLESILKVTETSAVEVARKVVIKFKNRSKVGKSNMKVENCLKIIRFSTFLEPIPTLITDLRTYLTDNTAQNCLKSCFPCPPWWVDMVLKNLVKKYWIFLIEKYFWKNKKNQKIPKIQKSENPKNYFFWKSQKFKIFQNFDFSKKKIHFFFKNIFRSKFFNICWWDFFKSYLLIEEDTENTIWDNFTHSKNTNSTNQNINVSFRSRYFQAGRLCSSNRIPEMDSRSVYGLWNNPPWLLRCIFNHF